MQKDYLYYLNMFIQNVQRTEHTDYASKQSVRQHNRAVDQYRQAAHTIGKEFPDEICNFANLLENEDAEVRISCAVCLIEQMQADLTIRERAIQLIKTELQNGNATPIVGWEMWLKQIEKEG